MAQETDILNRLGNLIDNLIHRQQLLEIRVNNVEQWTKQISEDIISTKKTKIERENDCYQPIVDDLDENNPP